MDQDFFENQNAITKAILEKDAKTIENVIAQSPWKSKRPLFEYALRLAINLDGGDINAVKMVLGNPRIDKNGEGYKLAITSAFTSAASAPDREVFEFMRETALTAGVDVAQAQKKP